MKKFYPGFIFVVMLASCSTSRFISKSASRLLLKDSLLSKAHLGIDIRDRAGKSIFNYQSDRYFIPASNTKILTCYVAMKYLGDSLISVKYKRSGSDVYLLPMGDPTVLHPDFAQQPLIDFLTTLNGKIYLLQGNWKTKPLGAGWSWGDYSEYYMAERSPMPVYGNILRWIQEQSNDSASMNEFEHSVSIYSLPEVNWKVNFDTSTSGKVFDVQRTKNENIFRITQGVEMRKVVEVPFITGELDATITLLPDPTGKKVLIADGFDTTNMYELKSAHVDSLLLPMMHRSDNFFAEQILLMVSQQLFGEMNEERLIRHVMDSDFNFLQEKPRWADGSGLSRYNLFTPSQFTRILKMMKEEFGIDRIKAIFPTGGEGTLRNHFLSDSGSIYAKTGSLSGVMALSGYLITRQGKEVTFSILVNNHMGNASAVRNKIEEFLKGVREKY